MGEMKNLSHHFYLSENNKGENSVKTDYNKSGNFDQKNRLKKIDKT